MRVRNAPLPPGVQALMAQIELSPDRRCADFVDKLAMGMPEHAPEYQSSVYTSSAASFLCTALAALQNQRMAFGDRLKTLIAASERYKSLRQFVIEGLKWPAESGPQRLNNYIRKNEAPENVIAEIARVLGVTREDLVSEGYDDALRGILLRLCELEGIDPDTADSLTNSFLAARRIFATYPEEGEPQMRARFAALSAWHLRSGRGPDTQQDQRP